VKAVILAEELDTRLKPYTTFLSKSMLPLEEKPIFEHIIVWTKKIVINRLTKKHIKNIFKN